MCSLRKFLRQLVCELVEICPIGVVEIFGRIDIATSLAERHGKKRRGYRLQSFAMPADEVEHFALVLAGMHGCRENGGIAVIQIDSVFIDVVSCCRKTKAMQNGCNTLRYLCRLTFP